MTDLKLFRQGSDGQDVELTGSAVALEVELQRRIEANMEAMLGVRFLASEYPTGPWHRGRVDSLGLDEERGPGHRGVQERRRQRGYFAGSVLSCMAVLGSP